MRHNNFPIYSQIHWVHSSFDIRIGNLEEFFPFDQHETTNDTDTTAVWRKGGPYKRVSRASAPRTCPSTAPYYALVRSDGNCPATPPAGSTPVSSFTTKESQVSFGCLYGSFSQDRYVRVAKAVTEDSEQVGDVIPEFGFTTLGVGDWTGTTGTPLTTSVPADGFVAWNSFEDAHLTPSAYGEAGAATSGYRAFMPGFSQVAPASSPAALIPRRAGGRRVLLVVHPHEGHARQRSPRILRVTARVRLVERPPHLGPWPLQRGDGRLRSRWRGQQRGPG